MKIYFDNIIYTLQKAGGISVVWTNLIKNVLLNKTPFSYTFLEYNNSTNNICRKNIYIPTEYIKKIRTKYLKILRYFNPTIESSDKFIFHSSYYRICKNKNAINITTVHDFTYEFFNKNYIKRKIHQYQKFNAIKKADIIVCISQNTKKDLLHFLPDIDDNKIKVIYNGVNEEFYYKGDKTYDNFVLFVGQRKGYKNFNTCIKPIADEGYTLYIVGGGKLTSKEKEKLENLKCNYKTFENISNEELNLLYNKAYCLVYPSLYEGFGLPVVEAQKAGCPVIAVNSSSIPEVIGDTRMLVEQATLKSITAKLKELKNPAFRDEIIKKGIETAKLFSWTKMTQEYIKLYTDCLK